MAESKSHKTTSNRIAKKYNTDYNNGKGVDIKSSRATIEVETPDTIKDAPRQLRGHKGKAYIAGTNAKAVQKAIEITKGTTIGVMDNQGRIVKSSTRKSGGTKGTGARRSGTKSTGPRA